MGAGKSTQGKLLAEALGLPQCSMDDVRWAYYREIGFDAGEQRKIARQEGIQGVYRYWKPFEVHAVERLLAEHRDCVIDFVARPASVDSNPAQQDERPSRVPRPQYAFRPPSLQLRLSKGRDLYGRQDSRRDP